MEKLALLENLARISGMSPETTSLNKAIDALGGIAAFARALGLKSHSVANQWRHTRVPAEFCPDIEALTGVRCEELRPDVNWSVLREKQPANTAECDPAATETVAPITIEPTQPDALRAGLVRRHDVRREKDQLDAAGRRENLPSPVVAGTDSVASGVANG